MIPPVPSTFGAAERLRSRKQIELLFRPGNRSVFCFPLKAVWVDIDYTEAPAKILISVPKKLYKHAVDRNLIRRRIREAYRLHKGLLQVPDDKTRLYGFICVAKETPDYTAIQQAMQHILSQDDSQ